MVAMSMVAIFAASYMAKAALALSVDQRHATANVLQATSENIPQSQLNALEALYNATNGPDWRWGVVGEVWNFTQPDPNPCSQHWQGVTCLCFNSTESCWVDRLNLTNYGLSGALPTALAELVNLTSLALSNNLLTGTLPSNIGQMNALVSLGLSNNLLVGSVPGVLFCGTAALEELLLDTNAFSGSIPIVEIAGEWCSLSSLALDSNYLTGSIPSSLGELVNLQGLALEHNYLTGTMPDSLQNLLRLEGLILSNNFLSGSLQGEFNSSSQALLTNIDLSQNQFTGTIPIEIFRIKLLGSFAATGNCLSGTLPQEICEASQLTALVLDGVATAPACRQYIFTPHTYFDAFTLEHSLSGTIPQCIFSMQSIETLHLSGNALSGGLPHALNISTKLTDNVLSYNHLTGAIPFSMHHNTFNLLDLSVNRFKDSLPPDFMPIAANGSLYLQLNRLFGDVPNTLTSLANISVLDGNMFGCGRNRGSLPANDPQSQDYNCGSSNVDRSMLIWAVLLILPIVGFAVFAVFVNRSQHPFALVSKWLTAFYAIDETLRCNRAPCTAIIMMMRFLDAIRSIFFYLAMFITLIMLPVFVILSESYPVYTHSFSWLVSPVLLTGYTPAGIVAALFTILLCLAIHLVETRVRSLEITGDKGPVATTVTGGENALISYGGMAVISIVNMAVMVTVDGVYVFIFLTYGDTVVTIAQLATAALSATR